jgi:hypothetical protein
MFTFITDKKPFIGGCKNDNLKSIISLAGGKKVLALFDKYQLKYRDQTDNIIDKMRASPEDYPSSNVKEFIPEEYSQFFTPDLIDLF